MTTEYKDALDAVTAIDIFKNTTDHNLKTLGEYIWPHQETIRRALRIADKMMQEPTHEMTASVVRAGDNRRYAVQFWEAMRDQLLKDV